MKKLALLLVLFVGSGCSALIYDIVCSQLLELVIGASAISLAVVLATFMGTSFLMIPFTRG
jgi:spermidine synthase